MKKQAKYENNIVNFDNDDPFSESEFDNEDNNLEKEVSKNSLKLVSESINKKSVKIESVLSIYNYLSEIKRSNFNNTILVLYFHDASYQDIRNTIQDQYFIDLSIEQAKLLIDTIVSEYNNKMSMDIASIKDKTIKRIDTLTCSLIHDYFTAKNIGNISIGLTNNSHSNHTVQHTNINNLVPVNVVREIVKLIELQCKLLNLTLTGDNLEDQLIRMGIPLGATKEIKNVISSIVGKYSKSDDPIDIIFREIQR